MTKNMKDLEMRQLKESAIRLMFTIGDITAIYDFTGCLKICRTRHENFDTTQSSVPSSFYILQDAEHKIEMFIHHLKALGHPKSFFYVNSLNYMFLDIKDLFSSIFFRIEGIIDHSNDFDKVMFSERINNLDLPKENKQELKKLTTLRDKLVHVLGYAKPKHNKDKMLSKLIDEGIRGITFNKEPNNPLIDETRVDNIQDWISLIEILLEISSFL